MNQNSAVFAEYCKKNFDFSTVTNYNYQSLSVCLIDCIYSLRAKYYAVTIPIVNRYAKSFMDRNRFAANDNLRDLLNHIEKCGGINSFTEKVIQNRQKLGRNIPKEEVLVKLAVILLALGINSMDDFRNYNNQEKLEKTIRSVKGMGDAGVNYLFMLAGDPNRCKPDVHIHRCIKNACGFDVSNQDCQMILSEATEILKKQYKTLTVRQLDGIIWQNYQAKK